MATRKFHFSEEAVNELKRAEKATKKSSELRRELAGKLHQYRPVDLNISQHDYWTVSDLAVAVEQWYGVVYKHSDGYIRILHRSGFTFQRDHAHFYGALNLCNGHEFALPRPDMTSVETAHFLHDLFACYPNQPILLLWDRASWHKGKPVAEVLAAHPHVDTVFFPPASPDLNPQEHVWSLARANVSHNHTLPDLPTLRDAFLRYLGSNLFRLT